jgi:hypothetical protein
MVMSFVSGTTDQPQVIFAESTDHGQSWSTRSIGAPGDRGLYAAPAISPDGSDVYVVYNAFTTPFRTDTTSPRALVGVVMHADSSGGPTVPTGTFTELNRSLGGDPRASSANALDSEFLGDYVYAAATRSDVAAVWNDASAAEDCPAIDAYRSALEANDPNAVAPAPESDCPATFGNSDIRGGLFTDPTP